MTHISLWQKYWPWSTLNKSVAFVQQVRRARRWDVLAAHYDLATYRDPVELAAYTSGFLDDTITLLLHEDDLDVGLRFLGALLASPEHSGAVAQAILTTTESNINDAEYKTAINTVDLLNKLLQSSATANAAKKILADIAEDLLSDCHKKEYHSHHTEAEDRKAMWQTLYTCIPADVTAILIKALDPTADDFDSDVAITTLDIAHTHGILGAIPAATLQTLLDDCLVRGLPESAYSVCWFAKNGRQKHLKAVAPSPAHYALVPFPINRQDNLTFLFCLKAQDTNSAVVAESSDDWNISLPEVMDLIRDGMFYYTAELDTTTDDTLNALALFFNNLAQGTDAVASVAQRMVPEIAEWCRKNNRRLPAPTPDA